MREALGIPANVDNFHGPKVTPVASRKLKNFGALGDLLEGDVFYFTAASVKRCGNDPGAPSGTSASDAGKPEVGIVGVEVEIKAKSKLTFSPREVRLQSGGVVFHASLDLERRLKGCTPQLKISWLKKDDVIKGFVLFDVPAPESKKLELTYQPTRWGGAGMVRVALPQCAGCAEAAPASR